MYYEFIAPDRHIVWEFCEVAKGKLAGTPKVRSMKNLYATSTA
jgi:hypothetical protein